MLLYRLNLISFRTEKMNFKLVKFYAFVKPESLQRFYVRPTTAQLKDIIQELYIKELKNYKPQKEKVDLSQVKAFSMPPKPKAPEVEKDVNDLVKEYAAPKN